MPLDNKIVVFYLTLPRIIRKDVYEKNSMSEMQICMYWNYKMHRFFDETI